MHLIFLPFLAKILSKIICTLILHIVRKRIIDDVLYILFSDIGLRNVSLNFRQQGPAHIMENIVYNELLVRGYNVDVGIVDVFAKNNEGKRVYKQLEVDFVVN
jgi:hypothetical protein